MEVNEYIETEFNETAGCTGYDKKTNTLMVPMGGNTNKIKVNIPGIGSNNTIYSAITFHGNGMALSCSREGEDTIVVTANGTAVGLDEIVEMSVYGVRSAVFKADILKKRTENVYIRAITDSENNSNISGQRLLLI